MKPWALYIRVSTVRQKEEGASLPAQQAALRQYATERGWVIPEEMVLIDGGKSGGSAKRPGYQRLLSMVREGKIAGVIGTKFNRIARNFDELNALIKLTTEKEVDLVAMTMQIDTTTPMGRMFVRMLALVDQYFAEDSGDQTSATMRYLRGKGYFTGGHCPPGCRVALVVNEEGKRRRIEKGPDADTVAPAWSWIIAGASLRDVGARFTAAGIPAARNKGSAHGGWSPGRVRAFLLSPLVTDVLVDAPTQAMVRSVLAAKTTPMRRGRDQAAGARAALPSPLAGILRCPTCEAAMHQVTATGNGGAYRYFRCTARGKGLCRQKDVRCEPVEDIIVAGLGKAAKPGGEYHRRVLAYHEANRTALEASRSERARLTSERDQLTARVAELVLRSQIGTAVWEAAMKALGGELERVDKRLAELAGSIAAGEVDRGSLALVLVEISQGVEDLLKGTREEKARAMRSMAAAVRIVGDEIILDLYEPVHPKDDPRGSPGGSSIASFWRAGRHGQRTIRVRVPVDSLVARCGRSGRAGDRRAGPSSG